MSRDIVIDNNYCIWKKQSHNTEAQTDRNLSQQCKEQQIKSQKLEDILKTEITKIIEQKNQSQKMKYLLKLANNLEQQKFYNLEKQKQNLKQMITKITQLQLNISQIKNKLITQYQKHQRQNACKKILNYILIPFRAVKRSLAPKDIFTICLSGILPNTGNGIDFITGTTQLAKIFAVFIPFLYIIVILITRIIKA